MRRELLDSCLGNDIINVRIGLWVVGYKEQVLVSTEKN